MVKSFGAERKISLRRMKNRLAQKKRCPEEGLFQPPCRGGAFQPETSPIHLSGLKRLITNVLLGFLKDETCFGKLFGGVGPTEKLTGAAWSRESRSGFYRVCLSERKWAKVNQFRHQV